MGLMDDIKSQAKGLAPKDISGSTESLVIEQKLNSLFYLPPKYKEELQMLKLIYTQNESDDRYGLHASAILASDKEFCYREQVLSLFFKQAQGENIKIGLKRIFEEGTRIGEKWQRLFIRGGIGTKEDMDISRFMKRYSLSYTPDAIITIGKKKYVVEIKSQNSFIYQKEKGHPKGMKQLKFYMYLTGIHDGFVLVDNKNDQNFKVLIADYDEDELLPYIERLEAIRVYKRDFVKERKMVDRHKTCKTPTCKKAQDCNMRDACFNVGMGRVRLSI